MMKLTVGNWWCDALEAQLANAARIRGRLEVQRSRKREMGVYN